mmetsp:Transcript_35043/g.80019  ORF Transcript_35043/g.80019 Transcript_35043/m.80019 type:complete len:650 (-) Transcript_35043:202-2151(-)
MPRGRPLERQRGVGLLFLRGRPHRAQLAVLLAGLRVCEHEHARGGGVWTDGTVALAEVVPAERRLGRRDAGGVAHAERRRLRLLLLFLLAAARGGRCVALLRLGAVDLHTVDVLLLLFFALLGRGLCVVLRVDVHVPPGSAACLLLLLGLLPRKPSLVLRRGAQRNSLHPLLRLLLLLLELAGVREGARPRVAHDLEPLGVHEVPVQPDGARRGQSEAQRVHEGVPVPVLEPKRESGGGRHLREAPPRSQRQRAVPPARVDQSRGEDRAHLCQRRLVLVGNEPRELVAERLGAPPVAPVGLLHVDHRRAQQRALPDVVGHVGQHRLQERDRLRVARAGHGDANGHAARIPDVGVEALQQQTDDLGDALGRLVKHERQPDDRRHPHVVVDVAHRRVEQDAHGLVRARAAVREGERVHGPIPDDRVAVPPHLLHGGVGVVLLAEVDERQAHGDAPDDLLVVRLAAVVPQLGHDLVELVPVGDPSRGGAGVARPGTHEDHPHGVPGRLARDGRVGVEQLLELGHDPHVARPQVREARAHGGAVGDDLVRVRVAQVAAEVGPGRQALLDRGAGAGAVDEAEGVEGPALGVAARRGDGGEVRVVAAVGRAARRQVRLEERHGLGGVPRVDDAHARRGRELGPVGRLLHPVEVVP